MRTNHLLSLMQEGFVTIHVVFGNYYDPTRRMHEQCNFPPPPSGKPSFPSLSAPPEKMWVYKARLEDMVKEGDTVVVQTPVDGLKCAQVIKVDNVPNIDPDVGFDYKWIVQKVDTTWYNQQLEKEDQFKLKLIDLERQKQRKELKQRLLSDFEDDDNMKLIFDSAVKLLNQQLDGE